MARHDRETMIKELGYMRNQIVWFNYGFKQFTRFNELTLVEVPIGDRCACSGRGPCYTHR